MVSGLPTVTSSAQAMDNLTYTYNGTNGNSLMKVEDGSSDTNGFKNGSTATEEYTYDSNGNLTADLNKGISNIAYNFLGKPMQMTFSDGKVISYKYDAGGNKLSMSVTPNGGSTTTTDYASGFVYEGGNLSFFGSPEGRVVKNGSSLEYQYSIADNQGNTRVVFTSVTPAASSTNATFESDSGDDHDLYLNVNGSNIVSSTLGNHTPGGSKVIKMNQNYRVGPAKSVRVYGGDIVDLEVYAYYETSTGYGNANAAATTIISAVAGAFGGVSGAGGESGSIFSRVNGAYATVGMAGNQGTTIPAAYLNYILFDNNNNVLSMGWKPVTSASNMNKSRVYFDPIKITEAGYIYTYLSYENESDNFVYFDDFKVTHTKSNVIQYNEYYGFGLQTASSWTRENTTDNKYLYNAANELNKDNGWYEMFYRGYDPATGRMLQIDPYATMYASATTYNYSLNNPVMMNDPSGGQSHVRAGDREMNVDGVADWAVSRMHEINSFNSWMEDYTADGGNGGGHYELFEYTFREKNGDQFGLPWYAWEWVQDDGWSTVSPLINVSDFVGWGSINSTNCKEYAEKQLDKVNVKVDNSTKNRIYLATENAKEKTLAAKDVEAGMKKINEMLDKGQPIAVGVHYKFGGTVNEGTTDHWLVIVGRGKDADGGYYLFYDNYTGNSSYGASSNNKFRLVDGLLQGTFTKPSGGTNSYVVSQVRPNL